MGQYLCTSARRLIDDPQQAVIAPAEVCAALGRAEGRGGVGRIRSAEERSAAPGQAPAEGAGRERQRPGAPRHHRGPDAVERGRLHLGNEQRLHQGPAAAARRLERRRCLRRAQRW